LPFLELFEKQSSLAISLHTSGPLALWLAENRPEYMERLRTLVDQERIEIIGGAFYEPILTMIPGRDRYGQISRFRSWLNEQFGTTVRGMWIPERVWEASLVSDLVDAGVEYTILDDYHFRCAGLGDDQLHGDYVTEDQGRVLRVFPGSETLRYMIPFRDPQESIDYLREIAGSWPGTTVVFADDGEKFGTWPETRQHVYEDGWLQRFFDALSANADWLQCMTLQQALAETLPRGKVWLPAASYREMTEWSLPVERQIQHERLVHDVENDSRWAEFRQYLRGGFWRNFKSKYPETDEMYARMMHVSQRLHDAAANPSNAPLLEQARDHLYRAQCNCPWWHGAFGGVYLPHLRNAVYHHLIEADNLIDRSIPNPSVATIEAADFDFDLSPEVRLANEHLIAWLSPATGGHLYELDVRSIGHNLLATMQRRAEAYHDKVRRGDIAGGDKAASIHDRVVFKQRDLDQQLVYDPSPRKALVDHFWPLDVTAEDVRLGIAPELGDFVAGIYESKIRRGPARNQLLMTRSGTVDGHALRIRKAVTLGKGGSTLELAWLLEGLPADRPLCLGIEFNFAGMPAGVDDRYFSDVAGLRLGQLGECLDLQGCRGIGLADDWLRLEARLKWDLPGNVWTFPVAAVSQSESGFELIHQSVAVVPVWRVRGDANGRWAVKMELAIGTHGSRNPPVVGHRRRSTGQSAESIAAG
jgi:alpha-amylase